MAILIRRFQRIRCAEILRKPYADIFPHFALQPPSNSAIRLTEIQAEAPITVKNLNVILTGTLPLSKHYYRLSLDNYTFQPGIQKKKLKLICNLYLSFL